MNMLAAEEESVMLSSEVELDRRTEKTYLIEMDGYSVVMCGDEGFEETLIEGKVERMLSVEGGKKEEEREKWKWEEGGFMGERPGAGQVRGASFGPSAEWAGCLLRDSRPATLHGVLWLPVGIAAHSQSIFTVTLASSADKRCNYVQEEKSH